MTKQQYAEEAGSYTCNRCKRVCDGPHCDSCEPEEGDAALPKCAKCQAECEAQTDAQREMEVCSDDCLIDAIGDMWRENRKLKRQVEGMTKELRTIRSTEPEFHLYADRGTAYAYAVGKMQGCAIVGLSFVPAGNKAA